jgi:hypothetical protein
MSVPVSRTSWCPGKSRRERGTIASTVVRLAEPLDGPDAGIGTGEGGKADMEAIHPPKRRHAGMALHDQSPRPRSPGSKSQVVPCDRHLRELELARRWRISPRTLARWRRTGRAPAHLMLGRAAIYPIDAVEAFEAERLRDGEDGA